MGWGKTKQAPSCYQDTKSPKNSTCRESCKIRSSDIAQNCKMVSTSSDQVSVD